MKEPANTSVLFVCMGNICRSPTAEGVFRAKVAQAGLQSRVRMDSAGTHNYHPGREPDERSQKHALARGYDLSQLKARQVKPHDFVQFDVIVAMDWDNLALLEDQCPSEHAGKLRLMMSFATPEQREQHGQIIPDPYHSGAAGFEQVVDLLEMACDGLVARLPER